jgi:hypothetical protein
MALSPITATANQRAGDSGYHLGRGQQLQRADDQRDPPQVRRSPNT